MRNQIYLTLEQYRFGLATEAELQHQIETVLTQHQIPFLRELRLDVKSRIDFFCSGLGIEVKIKGSATEIFRQCERYCQSCMIDSLILVTNKAQGMPTVINRKPIQILSLGKAWL